MLKEYQPRHRVKEHMSEIRFYKDDHGGFAFPCDADGNLLPMTEAARKNYDWAMEHPEHFQHWNELVHWTQTVTEPATGRCECGNLVTLWDQFMGACECEKCGRWYNLFGQELKKPEYWEEDY